MITDAKGDVAHVTIADVFQSNGVMHVIDQGDAAELMRLARQWRSAAD